MLEGKDLAEDKSLMMAQSAERLWAEIDNQMWSSEPFGVDGEPNPNPFFFTCKGENMELMWNRITYASYLLNNDEKKAWVLRAWDKSIPIFNRCAINYESIRCHGININFDADGFLDWWGFYIGVYEGGVVPIMWMINSTCIMTFMDKYSNVLLPLEAISEEERANWIFKNRIKALQNQHIRNERT